MTIQWHTIDGNEAAALVAHRLNEVIAIYPITPASPMGEAADAWSAAHRKNLWGQVPTVVEMQSEGGAAGAVHGALQAGALTTTFTASQGLLLMIPNLFKIAGELTSTVIHVAARSVATHALSIFGDHSDVMAARSTGWAMLCGTSVQESHDFAVISQAASLASRLPFLHFFDGFRTSHEVNRIAIVDDDVLRAMIDEQSILAHRQRALTPDRPVLRGTAQNPDVFFQAREAANLFYDAAPRLTQEAMDRFAVLTGRSYRLFEYVGHPEAERIIVLMGSGCGAVEEAVEYLVAAGERVGVVKVRLYRPFDVQAFANALPVTTRSIAVLDRTKEPGAVGEPLYQDVLAALSEVWSSERAMPRVIHGRYGLSSKEFTPAMGFTVTDLSVPVTKGTGGLTILTQAELDAEAATVCIRCGRCLDVCPLGLMPTSIAQAVRHDQLDLARRLDLEACCECGCCAYECPARVPLVQYLRIGKQAVHDQRNQPQSVAIGGGRHHD
jgi:pyruvate-ferredoxin/flavodoxin oxidoreductase